MAYFKQQHYGAGAVAGGAGCPASRACNVWGLTSVGLQPDGDVRAASTGASSPETLDEFRDAVKALHRARIGHSGHRIKP